MGYTEDILTKVEFSRIIVIFYKKNYCCPVKLLFREFFHLFG